MDECTYANGDSIKTLDIMPLIRAKHKYGYKFNMLMCWCIGKAASKTEEFYMLPVGNKLIQYDLLAVNTVVSTKYNDINTCDIPFSDKLEKFNQDYLELTKQVHVSGKPHNLSADYMVIGTSALAGYEIDGAVNIYASFYNNPFMIWGKYRKKLLKATLPISFQFHHTQLDGAPAAQFLECLQNEINEMKHR